MTDNISFDRNPGSISVKELADALLGQQQTIQLPVFQRDIVWDEGHIEKLWDSIFRGFPIGALLFAEADGFYKPLPSTTGKPSRINQFEETKFILIDGQQRTNAIALGLREYQQGDSSRLWIDLGGTSQRDPTIAFQFYVCSLRKPWGIGATDALKRTALKSLDRQPQKNDDDLLGKTWPVQAILPVPLYDLVHWRLEHPETSIEEFLPKVAPTAKKSGKMREDMDVLLSAVINAINYKVPYYLVNHKEMNELAEIFERLNRQGVAMSPEDIFFSALKMEFPQAHELVWDIFTDPETGKFLPPTKIVHLAVRLVAAEKSTDVIRLDSSVFRKFVQREDVDGNKNLIRIQEYLEKSDEQPIGKLHRSLQIARAAIAYQPGGGEDPGLPLPMIANLRPRVWQTLSAWIIQNGNGRPNDLSRMEMIRYALLDHFFIKSTSDDVTRLPFKTAFSTIQEFPGKEIYLLVERLLASKVWTPEEFSDKIQKSVTPSWGILNNENDLVMWNQRKFLTEWFPNYDSTLYRNAEDLPYDYEHIIAQSHMDGRAMRNQASTRVYEFKGPLLSGPGNIRFWPKSLNRSDRDTTLIGKNIIDQPGNLIPADSYLREYRMNSIKDVQAASIITEDQIDDWRIAANIGGGQSDWSNPDRLDGFRRATDKRRILIYTTLFKTVGFDKWLMDIG